MTWRRVALVVCGVASLTLGATVALAKPFLSLAAATHSVRQVRRIDINTATIRELRTLPGIGELLAQRIVAHRPYHELTELRRVKGITPRRFLAIAPRVTI